MTYAEKRVYKAKKNVKYVEEGYAATVRAVAELIQTIGIDDVPAILQELIDEYEIVTDAREDLAFAEDFLKKTKTEAQK
jgi:hypothetical protein